MAIRLALGVFLKALALMLLSGSLHAWDKSELTASAWGISTENWTKIRTSNIPVYGLLEKDSNKQFYFAKFSTTPGLSEAWVHLPSRKPTWATYTHYCTYKLFGARTCPRFNKIQFMDRDIDAFSVIGGVMSLGFFPLIQGVNADFEFDGAAYRKALTQAFKNSEVDPQAMVRLSAAWDVLKSREAEGGKLVDTATYNVAVSGTGSGALKGVSAKWLVEPDLQYPWVTKGGSTFDTFEEFHNTIVGMADSYARKPLHEFVTLASSCPGKRAEHLIKVALCKQVSAQWVAGKISMEGAMEVKKWKLPMPRFTRFSSEDMNIDYEQGMLVFTNRSQKGMDVMSVNVNFMGQRGSAILAGKRMNTNESGRFLGLLQNGTIRSMEQEVREVEPYRLDEMVFMLVQADYIYGFMQRRKFSVKHDLKGAELIRNELDQLQRSEVPAPVSISDREFVAVSVQK